MAYSPETLQLMMNRLAEYCLKWKLTVNTSKSKVMVIKNGSGRPCSNEQWYFNREMVEVVKEYKYLGVNITMNMNMETHLQEKLQKSKTAINATWQNCFNNKYIAHCKKYKVFESVSESVLFYAAQVWGGMRFETVEKLLRFYIKRIFRMPPNSPNYMVMLETGLSPLFIKTLKLHIIKVMKMPNYRLPKKIALHSIQTETGWFKNWMDIARESGIIATLDIEDIGSWQDSMYEVIKRLDEQIRTNYLQEASDSLYRTIYSRLEHNLQDINYFRDSCSVDEISTIFRLRGELLSLNFIPQRQDLPILCSICNLREREDILHFLGRCPVLRETRKSILGRDYLLSEQTTELLNEMDVKKYFYIAKLRSLTEKV